MNRAAAEGTLARKGERMDGKEKALALSRARGPLYKVARAVRPFVPVESTGTRPPLVRQPRCLITTTHAPGHAAPSPCSVSFKVRPTKELETPFKTESHVPACRLPNDPTRPDPPLPPQRPDPPLPHHQAASSRARGLPFVCVMSLPARRVRSLPARRVMSIENRP